MQTFIDFLWFVVVNGMWGLPWALMTAICVWAYAHKKSKVLAIQTLGAGGYFLSLPFHWALMWLLVSIKTPNDVQYSIDVIIRFFQWIFLAAFAAGFCWEKYRLYKNEKVEAIPVDPAK